LQSPIIHTGRLGLGAVLLGHWIFRAQRIDLPGSPIAYVPVKPISAAEFYETALIAVRGDG
jgi:hypothetical protein